MNNSLPRWLIFFLGLPLWGGIFFTGWYLTVLGYFWQTVQLFGAVIVLLISRVILDRLKIGRTISRVIRFLFWPAALASWLTMIYLAVALSPWKTGLLLGALLVVFFLESFTRRRRPLAAGLLLLFFIAGANVWHLILLGLPAAAVLLFVVWKYRPAWYPRGPRWLLWLLVLLVGTVIVPFSLGAPRRWPNDVASQEHVRTVYDTTDRRDPFAALLGREIRFGLPDCQGRVLVGTRGVPNNLVRLEPKKVATPPMEPIGDFIGLDCARRRVYAGNWRNPQDTLVLHIFDQDSLKELHAINIKRMTRTTQLRYLPSTDAVYISSDNSPRLFVYHLATWQTETVDLKGYIVDFAVFPQNDLLVTTAWGGLIQFYQLSTYALLDEIRFADFVLQLNPTPDLQTLWAAGIYSGKLAEISLADHRIRRQFRFRPGIRFVIADPESDRMYLGNYFTGEILALDRFSLQVERRYFVGNHLRNLALFPQPKRLLAASARGLTEIEIP
ncbi:MAG: hypothetical protein GX444_09020 [Myxococcales bacterium]|nr:hypothetical protein [Myxococcales bacterium]